MYIYIFYHSPKNYIHTLVAKNRNINKRLLREVCWHVKNNNNHHRCYYCCKIYVVFWVTIYIGHPFLKFVLYIYRFYVVEPPYKTKYDEPYQLVMTKMTLLWMYTPIIFILLECEQIQELVDIGQEFVADVEQIAVLFHIKISAHIDEKGPAFKHILSHVGITGYIE